MGARHAGLVPPHSLPGAEQAAWGGGGASVIVAMTMGEGNALSAQGPGGTAGREDDPALAPTPLGEKAFLHRREEGGGSSDLRLTLRGSGGPACVSRAPSPGAAAGRAWQMDLPPAPALGKHIRRRFLLPGQAELTFPGTGGAGRPPTSTHPLNGVTEAREPDGCGACSQCTIDAWLSPFSSLLLPGAGPTRKGRAATPRGRKRQVPVLQPQF